MKKILALAALAAMTGAMTLAGCGSSSGDGGGSGGGAAPTQTSAVPESAQRSVSGLLAYMNQLIAGTDDSNEPVFLGDATLPVDDATDTSQ